MFDDIIGATDIAFGASDIIGGSYNDLDTLFSGSYPMVVTGQEQAEQMSPATQAGMQRMQRKALAQELAARHAAAVVPRRPTKAREYPLGFPATTIAASATVQLQTQPQVPFRGRRLLLPSDTAGAVIINDLRVGKNSMFPTANPVPGRAFSELGVGVDLNLDTAQISQIITLSVTNISSQSVTLYACLIGTAVE